MRIVNLFITMVAIIVGSTTAANAQASKETSAKTVQAEPAKEKIKKEDLPLFTIKLLDGEAFKGWVVIQAYRVKSKDAQGNEVVEYQVDVKKDNLNQTLKFDKEGNPK